MALAWLFASCVRQSLRSMDTGLQHRHNVSEEARLLVAENQMLHSPTVAEHGRSSATCGGSWTPAIRPRVRSSTRARRGRRRTWSSPVVFGRVGRSGRCCLVNTPAPALAVREGKCSRPADLALGVAVVYGGSRYWLWCLSPSPGRPARRSPFIYRLGRPRKSRGAGQLAECGALSVLSPALCAQPAQEAT